MKQVLNLGEQVERAAVSLEQGEAVTRDRVRVYFRAARPAHQAPQGHILLIHGYGDHSGRYGELLERLAGAGFAVLAPDLRGHGLSGGRRTHCDRFEDYFADLDIVAPFAFGAGPRFVLGHSMGGLLATLWSLQHKEPLAGLVLSAPFFGLAMPAPRLTVLFAQIADRLVPWVPLPSGIQYPQLTRDPVLQRAAAADPLFQRTVTPRWFFESARAQERAQSSAPALKVPLYLFAGDDDPIADVERMRTFAASAGSADKQVRVYPGMRHEPLNEVDRGRVQADLVEWLRKHARAG